MSSSKVHTVKLNGDKIATDVAPNYTRVPGTNTYIDDSSMYVYSKSDGVFYETHSWRPKVSNYYSVPSASPGNRKIYAMDVVGQSHDCTEDELSDGSAWSYFTNVSGTKGKSNIAMLANVVEYVAISESNPTVGYSTVGWNELQADKKQVYIIEDGRGLYGTRYYVTNTDKEITSRGIERMPELPLPDASLDVANDLWEWSYRASPRGHQSISFASQFRSYLNQIVPAYTSLYIYSAKTGISASRLGKTTVELGSCNWMFPTHYKDSPHASFTGTSGSVEKKIARQQSSNCIIDDLNIPPSATDKDARDKIAILEMIVRATANHSEPRSRLRRNLTLAESSMFDMMPSMSGEIMPPLLLSLERRMVSIPMLPGDIMLDMYKLDWEGKKSVDMLHVGHMALREIERLVNKDMKQVRYEIHEYERDAEKRIRSLLPGVLGRELSQLCDDMPSIYARLLTGAWAVGRYAYSTDVGVEWSERLLPYIMPMIVTQVNRMEGYAGGDGSIVGLTRIYRNMVSSNMRVDSLHHCFTRRRKEGGIPEVPAFYEIDKNFWGYYSDQYEPVTSAFTDTVDGVPVYYPQQAYYNALIDIARRTPEYNKFRTEQDIIDAYVKHGWVHRRGSGEHVKRSVRMPGGPPDWYLELLLDHYILCEDKVTLVTLVTDDTNIGQKTVHDVTSMSPVNHTTGYNIENVSDQASPTSIPSDQNYVTSVTTVTSKTSFNGNGTSALPVCPDCRTSKKVHYENGRYGCTGCGHLLVESEARV